MPAPHDLVWLTDPVGVLVCAGTGGLPAWVSLPALAHTPLVVRRDVRHDGKIPVGLRGANRGDRHAAWVAPEAIRKLVTPMELAAQRAWRGWPALAAFPAIRALEQLAPRLDDTGLAWGVAGSAGFTLACGPASPVPAALHAQSDLDLVIRADSRLSGPLLDALAGFMAGAPARVDIQVATPAGGFALQELLRTGGRVLLKTDRGPCMTDDPWRMAA